MSRTRYAIQLLSLDFSQGNIVDVECHAPCVVIGSCMVVEQPSILIPKNGSGQHSARAALIVQIDPQAPVGRYRFVGIMPGIMVDCSLPPLACDRLSHVATIIAPDGRPLAIYEAISPLVEAEVPRLVVAPS